MGNRSVTDARGLRIAADDQARASFWNWYEGSVLVDGQGRPLPAVHFTDTEFDCFDHGAAREARLREAGWTTAWGRDYVFPERGFFCFVGTVPPRASRIAMPLYLRITNPLDLREGLTGPQASELISHLQRKVDAPRSPGHAGYRLRGDVVGGLRRARTEGLTGQQLWDLVGQNSYDRRDRQWDQILDLLGKDGMIFPCNRAGTYLGERRRGHGDGQSYLCAVAREPSQLKSALGNRLFVRDSVSLTDAADPVINTSRRDQLDCTEVLSYDPDQSDETETVLPRG